MTTLIIVFLIAIVSITGGILIYKNNTKKIDSAFEKAKKIKDVIKK